MGGIVGVTVRGMNGRVEPMGRWTNPLPFFINSHDFLTCKTYHRRMYMRRWYEMKADYDKNHETGKFELPMTNSYADFRLKAPVEYGLVVIDYKTKTILTRQYYTSFGRRDAVHFALYDDDQTEIKDLQKFLAEGRIKVVQEKIPKNGPRRSREQAQAAYAKVLSETVPYTGTVYELMDYLKVSYRSSLLEETDFSKMPVPFYGEIDIYQNDMSKIWNLLKKYKLLPKSNDESVFKTDQEGIPVEYMNELEVLLGEIKQNGIRMKSLIDPAHYIYTTVVYDMSPWQIINYPENRDGFLAMKAKMVDLGFKFNQAEDAEWASYLERFDEEEGEE